MRYEQISSWRDAEELAARWMRAHGYPDAAVTASGADGGVDVRAQDALAQVKFQASYVGRPALQQLVGARGLDSGRELLFFTGADYSSTAAQYADMIGIGLFTYTLDGTVTPRNTAAWQMAARGLGAVSGAEPDAAGGGTARDGHLGGHLGGGSFVAGAGALPGDRAEKPALSPKEKATLRVLIGLACWGWLVASLVLNSANRDELSDLPVGIATVLIVGGLGVWLIRSGVRRRRELAAQAAAARGDGPLAGG